MPDDVRRRWATLDAALARLRQCSAAEEVNESVIGLARVGCGARAASVGDFIDGVWTPLLWAGEIREAEEPALSAPVRGHQTSFGWLRVFGSDIDAAVVATFADSLGSLWSLIDAKRRADQQDRVLSQLGGALGGGAPSPIELVDVDASQKPKIDVAQLMLTLTPRQREVLDLMVAGLSNSSIADRLVVSLPTVKSHVGAILRACGAVNRAEAIARVVRGGGHR